MAEMEWKIPSVDVCRAKLEEAERKMGPKFTDNPTEYLKHYGTKAHRELVEIRDHWRSLLQMAMEMDRYRWRNPDGTMIPTTREKTYNNRKCKALSPEHFIGQCKRFLKELAVHEYGSPDWRTARNKAQIALQKAKSRATGPMDFPVVPPSPPPKPREYHQLETLIRLFHKYEDQGDRRYARNTLSKIRRYCREHHCELPKEIAA